LGEYDANGVPIYETIYLGVPVGVIKQTGTAGAGNIAISLYNVSTDQVGAPRIITRQSDEAIVWRWDSAEAFGATAPDQNPSSLGAFSFNQRFPGQVFDAESGLVQNWNREYNPRIGRYMQSDPIGLQGGFNTYSYVAGSPTSLVDPDGLDPIGATIGGVIGTRAGAVVGASIGTAIEPGFGTVVGGIAGAAAGKRLGSAIGSAIGDMCKADNSNPCKDRTFHRKKSPSQTDADAAKQVASDLICGAGARQIGGGVSPFAAAKAFPGPLPAGQSGIEFQTSVCPSSDGPITYWASGTPGVIQVGELACIPAKITKVVP